MWYISAIGQDMCLRTHENAEKKIFSTTMQYSLWPAEAKALALYVSFLLAYPNLSKAVRAMDQNMQRS